MAVMTLLPWTAPIAEQVRLLALLRCSQGWTPEEAAEFLGVHPRTVRRWKTRLRLEGEAGLCDRPRCGRPSKFSAAQVEQVLGWIDSSPRDFGFITERWTAPRLATVIKEQFGVQLNHRYLNDWLRRHGVSPQIPERRPRERDPLLIEAWVRHQWPRIKKSTRTARTPDLHR
jgi:transposase